MTSTYNRAKRIAMAMVMAVGLAAAANPAMASDTIKGTNGNGFAAVVPVEPIASFKLESGKLYYRHQFSMQEYYLLDPTGSIHASLQAKLVGNYAANPSDGWTYVLRKVQITCNPATSSTQIWTLGQSQSSVQSDGCQFWQTANGT